MLSGLPLKVEAAGSYETLVVYMYETTRRLVRLIFIYYLFKDAVMPGYRSRHSYLLWFDSRDFSFSERADRVWSP